jgi:polyketide synthase 5
MSGAADGAGKDRVQPTLFAMQVALEASMRAYGVRPGAPGNFFTTTPP